MITIFTDGASRGNPGPGGYGAVLKFNHHRKELSEGFRLTTNNRMELLADIRALQELKMTGIPVRDGGDSAHRPEVPNDVFLIHFES
jgi:ribonuclease HI